MIAPSSINIPLSPPNTLSVEAKLIWCDLQSEYNITDAAGLVILQAVCESYDRMRQAFNTLKAEGLTTEDRYGQAKVHPAALIERDARAAMLSALKQLNLDIEPLKAMGRPPGPVGWSGRRAD